MPIQNCMTVNTITTVGANATIDINLADDEKEVRGFGMPIKFELCRTMITDYITEYKKAKSFIDEVDQSSITAITDLKAKGFENLKGLFSDDKHIISGVFGKELILQMLAQKHCEGIRYNFGIYNGAITLILFGVKDGEPTMIDGREVATSEPLNLKLGDAERGHSPSDDIIGEVHGSSKTITDLENEMETGFQGGILGKLLGTY